jgi:hypothetical protein
MADSNSTMTLREKSTGQMLAEDEARRVIEEARAAAEARALARAKAREEDETWLEAAKSAAKTKAEDVAAEEARIAAASRDEWYYIRNNDQIGPVGLVELRRQVADSSLEPPVRLVWTEGMAGWRPVYEVRKVCDPTDATAGSPGNAGNSNAPANGGASVFKTVAEVRAEQESKAALEAKAKAAEEARHAVAAKTRAMEELRSMAQIEEKLLIAAKAKAAEQARLKAAEAKQPRNPWP